MKTVITLVFGFALLAFCSESFAQCPSAGGGGASGGGQGFASSQRGGSQGGSQGQLLIGPGSYFNDVMVQNFQRQQLQRQQAAIAAVKLAKKNYRKSKQLDTRRAQREEELARREAKKRSSTLQRNLYGTNQVQLASRLR